MNKKLISMEIIFENTDSEYYEIQRKSVLDELKSLCLNYPGISKAYVLFNICNDYRGSRKTCEIKLLTTGPEFLVISNEKTFKKAISDCISDLVSQLADFPYNKVA